MATCAAPKSAEKRKNVMVGELPADFLRVVPPAATVQQQQVAADEQAAMLLQQQLTGSFLPVNSTGRLNLTIAQAKLNKNYGVTRMDPYCRVRIGHTVYETHTDHNGAKNPVWNKVIHSFLPAGVNSFYLEIFDECAFTVDERIAWGHFIIPECVFNGETTDDWYPLSGRQGDEKEGMINIVMTITPISAQHSVLYPTPVVMVPSPVYNTPYYPAVPTAPCYMSPPVCNSTGVPPQPQQPQLQQPQVVCSEEDLKQVHDMFPSVDMEVIRSVMEANNGNKDATVNSLLQITSEN